MTKSTGVGRGGARANSGGRRPGAGRLRGSKTKIYRPHVEKVLADLGGVLPKEVMLAAMRRHYQAERYDKAARIAALAAPYIHPRLSAAAITVRPRLSEMSDDELQAFLGEVAEAEQELNGADKLSSAKPAGSA